MSGERMSAGHIRGIAQGLIRAWEEAGSDYFKYTVVWEAKEYLHALADRLDDGPSDPLKLFLGERGASVGVPGELQEGREQ